MNNVILRTLSRTTVSSSCFFHDTVYKKQLPICKVCLMTPWSREFSKSRLLVTKNNGSPVSDLCLPSLSLHIYDSVWRETLIHKLAHVKSSDQPGWIKTEDRIGDLLNDDQMLTIENTDQTIKTFENCVVVSIIQGTQGS